MHERSTASYLNRSTPANAARSGDDPSASESVAVSRSSPVTVVDDAGRNRRHLGVRVVFTAERALNRTGRLRLRDDFTGA
jgi:hypothetical protein